MTDNEPLSKMEKEIIRRLGVSEERYREQRRQDREAAAAAGYPDTLAGVAATPLVVEMPKAAPK